jgi:peptidoglycan/xylan/chitin deacetylase (PgdA/CDA1 family)
MRSVPILLYHSVSAAPSASLRDFTVSPHTFERQLDLVVASGATAFGVSTYLAALATDTLPERPVVITFDDGYADFATNALPALEARSLPSTMYITTGFLEGRPRRTARRPPDRFLTWAQLPELMLRGVEIGGHSNSHVHLDTLGLEAAWEDVVICKKLLEEALYAAVPSFAYPNGHSSAAVRRLVVEAGYESACGVRNSLSWEGDDRFRLARLTVMATTSDAEFSAWLDGSGAPLAPRRELLKTRAFRAYRRTRSRIARQPVSDFEAVAR